MLNDKITGNNVVSSDFMRVLLTLKENIMFDLNVAEVMLVTKITDNAIYCNALHNNTLNYSCAKLKDINVSVGDCVLVIFNNTDFRVNLDKYRKNKTIQNASLKTDHNTNYGIIIGVLERKGE